SLSNLGFLFHVIGIDAHEFLDIASHFYYVQKKNSEPSLSLPLDFINSSFADCGKDDPEINKEMKKDIVALLTEELSLHENVTNDSLQRTKALIMSAKRTSSHYQKEAEKCNTGVETCEEARERAEVKLRQERKLTALWMNRAHQFGWKDETNDFL
ncbi:hypothetical protein MIMGU_mgv11b023614mg, partial [Erythranthe guttata]